MNELERSMIEHQYFNTFLVLPTKSVIQSKTFFDHSFILCFWDSIFREKKLAFKKLNVIISIRQGDLLFHVASFFANDSHK